jgi:hypothetical protein
MVLGAILDLPSITSVEAHDGVGRGGPWGRTPGPPARGWGQGWPEMDGGGVFAGPRADKPPSVVTSTPSREVAVVHHAPAPTDLDPMHEASYRANAAYRLALWVPGWRCRDASLPTHRVPPKDVMDGKLWATPTPIRALVAPRIPTKRLVGTSRRDPASFP